jgi:hypothetical protein
MAVSGLLLGGGLAFVYVYRPVNWSWQQQSAFRISVCALPHKPTKTAKRDVLVLECQFGIESSSGIESPEFCHDLFHLSIHHMRVRCTSLQAQTGNQSIGPRQ